MHKYTINWLQTLAVSNPLYKHQQHFGGRKGVLHSGDPVIQQSAVTIVLAILVQTMYSTPSSSVFFSYLNLCSIGWLVDF